MLLTSTVSPHRPRLPSTDHAHPHRPHPRNNFLNITPTQATPRPHPQWSHPQDHTHPGYSQPYPNTNHTVPRQRCRHRPLTYLGHTFI